MSSRALSTFLIPLLTFAVGCNGDNAPADDEVDESGTDDTTADTSSDDAQTESSDTAETTTDEADTTDTTDTTEETTDATDTTDDTDTTDTTDTEETTDGEIDGDMDGVPLGEDCDDDDPNNFPGNTEVCDGQDNDCDMDADSGAVDAETYYPDNDMDGYGNDAGSFVSCEVPPGTVQVGGDCNDEDPEAYPDSNAICALGPTCLAIYESGAGDTDGVYLVDPAGVDVGGAPIDLWCDMTNGGLTAALVINSNKNFNTYIGDFGSNYVSTDLLAADPAEASNQAAQEIQAWLDLNEYEYVDFRLAAYSDTVNTFTSGWIARASLRIEFGQNGYLLYAEPNNGYSWCGGASSYTDGGVGQVNKPANAPNDCKGHVSLGSGWDFSLFGNVNQYNAGLTLCGGDASTWMFRNYGNSMIFYPTPGAAYVVWTR